MNRIFQFQPLVMDRVWGGRALEEKLGRVLPDTRPYGESWEIVDRPEAQSVVKGGPYDGQTLDALLAKEGRMLLGSRWKAGMRFPLLVKWLDCRERLSLQVHPPASVAAELGGEPKTENWYIADCEPDSRLIVGLRSGVTRELFEKALQEHTLEELVHSFPVEAGDSILVESGRLHAIDSGNLILEIQQNSDTTYRVYDWGRMGLDSQPRQLHVRESLRSINFKDFEPDPLNTGNRDIVLADCAEFRIRKKVYPEGSRLAPGMAGEASLLHLVEGTLEFPLTEDGAVELRQGDNVLIPADFSAEGRSSRGAVVLLTDRFL